MPSSFDLIVDSGYFTFQYITMCFSTFITTFFVTMGTRVDIGFLRANAAPWHNSICIGIWKFTCGIQGQNTWSRSGLGSLVYVCAARHAAAAERFAWNNASLSSFPPQLCVLPPPSPPPQLIHTERLNLFKNKGVLQPALPQCALNRDLSYFSR